MCYNNIIKKGPEGPSLSSNSLIMSEEGCADWRHE
jgi:hypothetical protein